MRDHDDDHDHDHDDNEDDHDDDDDEVHDDDHDKVATDLLLPAAPGDAAEDNLDHEGSAHGEAGVRWCCRLVSAHAPHGSRE